MSNIDENKIISQEQTCYSYHIFQFPFKWLANENTGRKENFETLNRQLTAGSFWERKPFKLNNLLAYNEYQYFYPFVRDAIYDRDAPNGTEKNANDKEKNPEPIECKHYELNISDNALYEILVKGNSYTLEIESIILDVYALNAGILSFHLYNRKQEQSSPLSILEINQYGRRVYPPFFKTEKEAVATAKIFEDRDLVKGLEGSKGIEIAHQIALINLFNEKEEKLIEDFSAYGNAANFEDGNFPLPKIVQAVLKKPITDNYKIEHLLDDRMFVISWYGNNDVSKELLKISKDSWEGYTYKNDDWWFKYLYVDGGSMTCQNAAMRNHLIENSTNARWADYGTFFGTSRYSFVLLTDELSNLKLYNTEFLLNHIQTIYFQMTRLVLLQRVMLLNFSEQINQVSKLKPNEELFKQVEYLYQNYITFINKIHFREVTAQDQGIELYDLLTEKMRINKDVEHLSKEMQELHSYVNLMQQKEQSDESATLTKIATIFLVPTLVISLLSLIAGQRIDFEADFEWEMFGFVFIILIVSIVSFLFAICKSEQIISWLKKYFRQIKR